MRILHLEASTGWGGQEMRILQEMQGMRAKGHALFLITEKGAHLANRAREQGFWVEEIHFGKVFWVSTLFRLLWFFKKFQIELVNTHSSLDSWIGGIAAFLAKRPLVRTRHLSTPIKAGFNSRFLYGILADFVVTTCAEIVPIISSQAKKPKELCCSIPTGVDLSKLQVSNEAVAAFRASLGIKKEDFVVGTACVMRSWKGIDDLLKAAHRLRHLPDVKWVLIGGGHRERHLLLAKELQLEETVFFTGHLEPPFTAMAALDLFMLLSTANEGVSQAMLQAAALKKPLLATRIGGLMEICREKENGILVEPFSPDQVAEAVLFLKGASFLQEWGNVSRRLVEDHFTQEKMILEMEEVYQKVVSRKTKTVKIGSFRRGKPRS